MEIHNRDNSGGKSCIVTGGNGYIGSYLVRSLVNADYKVYVICRSKWVNACSYNSMVETIHMDLCDIDEYGKLHAIKSDNVIHLAGQSLSSKSIEDPLKDLKSNVIGTINMLQWCKDNNVRKFVYASTMRVYGDHDKPLHEEMLCAPDSFYGVSKYAAEHYVRLYAGGKLDTVIFRLFNVYGPGGGVGNHPHGLVASLFSALLRKEPIVSKGSFDRVRDLIHLSDVINVFFRALEAKYVFNGAIYNLASGISVTIGGLIDEMISVSGYNDYPIIEEQMMPGDCFKILADINKISSKFNWLPRVTLSEGIKEMVGLYLHGKPLSTGRI